MKSVLTSKNHHVIPFECGDGRVWFSEAYDALREEVNQPNQEIRRQQMELDILKKAAEIIKKTRASASALRQAGKRR